jgi:drug/metabolite transporter (DMT)-like permease
MWLFLSLGTAFFAGSSDALSKHLVKKYRVNVVAFIKAFWGSVFLLPFILIAKKPMQPKNYWTLVGCAVNHSVPVGLGSTSGASTPRSCQETVTGMHEQRH